MEEKNLNVNEETIVEKNGATETYIYHVENASSCNTEGEDANSPYYPYVKGSSVKEPQHKLIVGLESKQSTKINWCALLFGWAYYAYRKCYLEALAMVGIVALLAFVEWMILPATFVYGMPSISGAIAAGLSISLGFLFYPIYRRRIDIWIKAGKDPEKTGGVSVIGLIISLIIIIVAVLVYVETTPDYYQNCPI